MLALMTGLRRGIEAVNLDQGSPVPLGFIVQLADELAPSDIADGFCEAVVLDHVLDCQTLHADHLVFANYAGRELVLVVTPAVIDTSMHTGDFETGFVPVLGTFLLFRMPSLSLSKSLFIFGIELGIADCLASGEDHHGCNAKVKTDHVVHDWQRFNLVHDPHGHEIAICAILGDRDRAGCSVFGKISMEVDIQGSIHLGQSELLPIPFERVSRIGSRLAALFLFERGILGSSLKEVFEGGVQMSQGLLNRHTGNISEPRMFFLEIRQHGSEVIIVELLSKLIGSRAGMQSPIVHVSDTSERLSKDDSLLIGWIEPILIRPLLFAHCLFPFLLPLDMFLYRGQDLSIERAIILFSYLSYLFQQLSGKPDSERFNIVFHATILSLIWLRVKWLRPLCPSPTKGTQHPLYPHG